MWKIVIVLFVVLSAFFAGYIIAWNRCDKKRVRVKALSDKHLTLFLLMNEWTRRKIAGKNVETFFISRGYYKVAIYGMSYVGETLLKELRNSCVEVVYGIDSNADMVYVPIRVVNPNEDFEEVDCIIVTPITTYDAIGEMLKKKVKCPIFSIEDIISEI